MSGHVYDLLSDIATRCNIRNDKILRKSKELIALLNSKQQLNCSDTCKVVVCLELASSLSSSPLSRTEAIKYSGCKKKMYCNFYNIISKILNLDKIYSVKEICLLVGVSDAQEQATKLFKKYQSVCEETENDLEHPMYACAAVFAFCRANKMKINFTQLVEISRIKKLELEELAKKFQPLIEIKKNNPKSNQKGKHSLSNTVEKEGGEAVPRKKKATSGLMSDEEYLQWKKKMLED